MDTLVVIYKNVGEKVRNDILKRGLPQARLTPLLTKFDEVLANGQVEAEEVAEVRSHQLRYRIVKILIGYRPYLVLRSFL